jgi:hypothetical protein
MHPTWQSAGETGELNNTISVLEELVGRRTYFVCWIFLWPIFGRMI